MALSMLFSFLVLSAIRDVQAACPPVSGSFSIEVQNLYPESADWDPQTCKLYLRQVKSSHDLGSFTDVSTASSSAYNITSVAYDPYTNTSEIIGIPGVSNHGVFNYTEYHGNGIDYDASSGLIYFAIASANAYVASSMGNYSTADYTGPNRIIRYNPIEERIDADISLQDAQDQYQNKTGNLTNGFQDMAENSLGDSFAIGTFGNSIVKIPANSSDAYLWYAPSSYDIKYGFGGIFTTATDKIVVSDTLSGGLVTFDSLARDPQPTYVPLQGLPADYRPLMADGLYLPSKYNGSIALWSDDFNGTSVYSSEDDWQSAHFLGLVPIDSEVAAEGGLTVASFEIGDSIFSLSEFFQERLPVLNRESWPVVDITEDVDRLVDGMGEA